MKYKDVIKVFETFANNHPDIARFKSDTEDRIDDFSIQKETFPLLYVSPTGNIPVIYPTGYKATSYGFNVFCLVARIDLEDIEEDNVLVLNQTNNNLEQCMMILQNLKVVLYDNFDELTVNLTPINQYGTDLLQGWMASFNFEIADDECF